MSREQVAKRRSESNRVTGTVGSRVASRLIVGGRDETLEGGNGGWSGDRGARDDHATAKLHQAVGHQRDDAGSSGRARGSMINAAPI